MSTDLPRKFPLAAVCTALFASLCIPGGDTKLEPCYPDGVFEVVENSTTNKMTCEMTCSDPEVNTRFFSRQQMEWQWHTNGTNANIGYCRSDYCSTSSDKSLLFSLSTIPDYKIQLTINTINMTLFSRSESFTNSTISCIAYRFAKSTCRTDLVYPAKDSTCYARFERSPNKPWSVVTRCNIPKAYSALNRYSCQSFIAEETVGSPVVMATTPLGTDYVSGSCFMTSGLPSVDGNLTVMIIPGRINVTMSAVKQPSCPRVDHTCPPYVGESSDLSCTCTTEDKGSPPGFLQWQGSSSADLIRANVSRADDGTVYTCHLLWNAKVVASKHYTLRVTPVGDLYRQARAEGHTSGLSEGVGIGIGVFLAVAVIAVAVLVAVGWRRGWTLPWAASPDTTKQAADNMHSVDASNISQAPRERVGPAAVPGTGNEGQRLYEGIRHSEVNLPSAYEALRPGNRARASAAAARGEPMTEYQNYAFGPDRPADVPAGRKKGKKHEKKAQNESPVYGNA